MTCAIDLLLQEQIAGLGAGSAGSADSRKDPRGQDVIARLSLAVRGGNLCLDSPDTLEIPNHLVTDVTSIEDERHITTPLCRMGSLLWFCRHYELARQVARALHEFREVALGGKPSIAIDITHVEERLQALIDAKKLLPLQAEAVRGAMRERLLLITGGPGTGKTYTAGMVLRLLFEGLSPPARRSFTIGLAAPTGKAAARLQESLENAVRDMSDFPTLKATTLHALLSKEVDADLVLVDESSMIDATRMAMLLQAIPKGTRLIMLGDRHQLPSVEAGGLFADLLALLPPTMQVSLTASLRVELKSLLTFANAILEGNVEEVFSLLDHSKEGVGAHLFPEEVPEREIQRHLLATYAPLLSYSRGETPEEAIARLEKLRLLSPIRGGTLGVEAINARFFEAAWKGAAFGEWVTVPIMVTRNDSLLELYNGDTGVLVRQKGESALFSREDRAYFLDAHGLRSFPAVLLPPFELAYCLSVHKAQGSEFEKVVLVLPEGSEKHGREVLYTGVTRARRTVEIWGSRAVVAVTIKGVSHRISGLMLCQPN